MAVTDPREIFDRLPMSHQRALVSFFVEQGRHLENLGEWTREDNFTTTDELVKLYTHYILPLEGEDKRCTCGNDRHNDAGDERECEHENCEEWCDLPKNGHYTSDGTWVPEVKEDVLTKKPIDLLPGDMIDMTPVYDELEKRGLLEEDEDDTDRMTAQYEYRMVIDKPQEYKPGEVRFLTTDSHYFLPADIDVPVADHDTKFDAA